MIQQKLTNLKRLISDLDQEKLQTNKKIDSISLISDNLCRTKSMITNNNNVKTSARPRKKKMSMVQALEVYSPTLSMKMMHRRRSVRDPFAFQSPGKGSPRKLTNQYLSDAIKTKLTNLARKLYDARNLDMEIKFNQTGWQQFLKTFLLKNSQAEEERRSRIDLSGLGLVGNSMKVAIQILNSYQNLDLSRNILSTTDVLSFGSSQILQQLVLQNCGMRNQQLCTLFQLLLETPIKRLCLSSPDIKDRNNLTKYQELYTLIEQSQTLQSFELSNIQINPQNQIFQYARKSKTLRKLDLSKNSGVVGICKNIKELNLSWNGISQPYSLKCNQTSLTKLDLTGNPLRSHLFEEFLIITNFPNIQILVLNKIAINEVGTWLQSFIQRTRSLQKLSLMECQLTKQTFLNVVYGLQLNKSLKYLNLSNNKFPSKVVAEQFAVALQKSSLSHLYLQQCDIKDQYGAALFQGLDNNTHIQYIDVSKNNLSQKSSEKICENLKKGCFNLLVLITTQNFIKYIQLKQIVGYISRNVFMAKGRVRQQYKKYKSMNENTTQLLRSIQKAQYKINQLKQQTLGLQQDFMRKQCENDKIKAQVLQQKIRLLNEEEEILERKKAKLEEQLQLMMNEAGEQQSNYHNESGVSQVDRSSR